MVHFGICLKRFSFNTRKKVGTHKEKMTNTQALDIVIQQLLQSEHTPYKLDAGGLQSDAKGVLGLHAVCRQLAGHNVRPWMRDMARHVIKKLDPAGAELIEMMRARYCNDLDADEWIWEWFLSKQKRLRSL